MSCLITPKHHGHEKCHGFNFSEIMITVAMIGVLSAIATPSMSQFFSKTKLDDALLRLQGALRETQSEAIRRNQSCTITITPGLNSTVTGTCLVTGDRPLPGIEVHHNHSGGRSPWTVTFDERGRNKNPRQAGTAVLVIPGQPSLSPKCLVLSVGIGLHRIGQYNGNLNRKPAAKYCLSA